MHCCLQRGGIVAQAVDARTTEQNGVGGNGGSVMPIELKWNQDIVSKKTSSSWKLMEE